ncbi:MAG: DUF2294 family protein [Nitrospira sp. CR2.1]|nr:DUF2294 family protein [Nitrospira sp. CR2.1]
MASISSNKADVEYAVMMTVLNFHSEFMRSGYSHVDVQWSTDLIHVTLTKVGSVPAEARLAQSEEGRALLRRVHEALFTSCQEELKERIETVVDRKVRTMVTSLDPVSGSSHLAIKLHDAPMLRTYPQLSTQRKRVAADRRRG